jgi:hypothetical protein
MGYTIWVSPSVITPNTSWVVVFVFRDTAATFVPTYAYVITKSTSKRLSDDVHVVRESVTLQIVLDYNKINWICIQVLKREDTLFLSKIFASWEASYTSDYALRGSLGHFISFPPTHPTIWSWHLKVKSPKFNYWAVP